MSINAPFYNPQHTDLTIFAGENETRFEVHRCIVTLDSEFLKVICQNTHFKEGIQHVVRLPTMDADTVRNILGWFYQLPLELPEDPITDEGYEKSINLLNAADYLGIPKIIPKVVDIVENYLVNCKSWDPDRELATDDEQKKVDLLCRIYEVGGVVKIDCLKTYLKALKKTHHMGMFMKMVGDLEDCHEKLFGDVMMAMYATVD
ncbi:hypothetical protein ABW19_dt0207409 [Dactylella cylindrospora]|nr:hypothetical protein ABW19_dt0207409 [Dactylella cylindrospora]